MGTISTKLPGGPLDLVTITPEVAVARAATLIVSVDSGRVEIEVEYDRDLRKMVATSVKLSRVRAGTEVTAVDLRTVKVQEYIRQGALGLTRRRHANGQWIHVTAIEKVRGSIEGGDVERDAAVIYIVARLLSYPPLKEVASALGVSQSTATKVVARARARGLLD